MAAGFRTLLKWLSEILDPLYQAVRQAAQTHLAEFGYKSTRREYGGIQSVVELEHCRVTISIYKNDFECGIEPISSDSSVEYETRLLYEEPLSILTGVRHHVRRCISIIIDDYKSVLQGDFEGWPKVDRH